MSEWPPADRAGPLPSPLGGLAAAARAYAAKKDSANTRQAYASDWRGFARWCPRQGFDADRPDPRVFGLFLTASADGKGLARAAVSTIERRLAAITTHYRSVGTPLESQDRHIVDVMAHSPSVLASSLARSVQADPLNQPSPKPAGHVTASSRLRLIQSRASRKMRIGSLAGWPTLPRSGRKNGF